MGQPTVPAELAPRLHAAIGTQARTLVHNVYTTTHTPAGSSHAHWCTESRVQATAPCPIYQGLHRFVVIVIVVVVVVVTGGPATAAAGAAQAVQRTRQHPGAGGAL